MKQIISLTDQQRAMVENNLDVVRIVIAKRNFVNPSIIGFSYEDIYQEGCVLLCHAAAAFREERNVKFKTYAEVVITNGLKNYCRLIWNRQKRMTDLVFMENDDGTEPGFPESFLADYSDKDQFEEQEILAMLHSLKGQYSGTVRLGIEAIEMRFKGLKNTEIAEIYGVRPNLVGAWISRAVQKLSRNFVFNQWIGTFPQRIKRAAS